MKKLLLLFGLFISFPALAADNAVVITTGAGVTMRTKDVGGGVQSSIFILGDTSGTPITTLPVSMAGTVTISGANLSTAANQASAIALLTTISTAVQGPIPACTGSPCATTIGNVGSVSQYPAGAVPLTASITGTSVTTATLAGTSGKTTFICTYSIRANATAATTVYNSITGIISGTQNHVMWVAPAASGLGVDEQIFVPCAPASAANTGISVISGNPGSGGNVSATATGYQL